MPDMKLAYIVTNVGNGNKFLSDSMEYVPLLLSQQSIDGNRDGNSTCNDATMPTEIFMIGLGSYSRRPVLFLRTKTDVLIYRVSNSSEFLVGSEPDTHYMILSQVYRYSRGHLKIRFRKLSHNIMLPMNEPVHRMEIDENGEVNSEQMNRIRTIRYFGESPPVATSINLVPN